MGRLMIGVFENRQATKDFAGTQHLTTDTSNDVMEA